MNSRNQKNLAAAQQYMTELPSAVPWIQWDTSALLDCAFLLCFVPCIVYADGTWEIWPGEMWPGNQTREYAHMGSNQASQ